MIKYIIIFSIIIVGSVIFLIGFLTKKKYNDFVLENSLCLKQLNEINSRYNFYPFISFDQYHTYDNENFYDTVYCRDYLIYQLQYIKQEICRQIGRVTINNQLYSKYISEIQSIRFGQFQVSTGRLKTKKLLKSEKRLTEKRIYCAPVTRFALKVTLYCSKINGQVYKQKSDIFFADDILALIKRLNNKSGNYFHDREIWEAICRVERGKVSNKMRFSIYARDGYRCRNCGVSERYAKLEIDHIIPIAKGGKTTYNNLQTLCHKCNVEKGDSIYSIY